MMSVSGMMMATMIPTDIPTISSPMDTGLRLFISSLPYCIICTQEVMVKNNRLLAQFGPDLII